MSTHQVNVWGCHDCPLRSKEFNACRHPLYQTNPAELFAPECPEKGTLQNCPLKHTDILIKLK